MKKLLSLFGLLGLLAFVATPIYAQEEDVVLDVEQEIVAEAEDLDAVADEFNNEVDEAVEDVTEEIAEAEAVVEDTAEDLVEDVEEEIEDVPSILEDEESQNELGELDLSKIIELFSGFGIATLLVGLVWIILVIIAMWKIFSKAGEPGWLAIIPFVNMYIMYKIVGMKNWFWYTLLVAFASGLVAGFASENPDLVEILSGVSTLFGAIVAIVAAYKLPRKFGWGVFSSILYVLFTGICILILGFGGYKYLGKSEKEPETIVEA